MNRRNRLAVIGLIAMVGVLGAKQDASAVDEVLIENGGFESADQSWSVWGDGDIKQEYHGVKPQEGNNLLRMWKRSGWYQDFPTKKDSKYTVSVFVNTAGKDPLKGDAYAEVKVEWRNKTEGDSAVGEPTSVKFDVGGKADTAIPVDTWTQITLPEVKAPDKATHCRVLVTIWCTDEKGGGCALFDGITVTPVAP
jgi:hypothetical protein